MSGTDGAHDLAADAVAGRSEPGRGAGVPARYERRRPQRPTVSVIVPTYNERDNIDELLVRLGVALVDLDHEIIVVDDDSPDRTWQVVEEHATTNPRVAVLRRVGRRGLSSAVIEGMTVARGAVLAVIDADLQHDETVLPDLVSGVIDDGADICIGSRKAPGGSYGDFGRMRHFVSWAGDRTARLLLGVRVSDPMTGFFAVSRHRFDVLRPSLDPRGFKIGLELLARGPKPTIVEVPFQFRPRARGTTKLTGSVVFAYLWSVTGLALARRASRTASTYAAVALTALCIRLSLATMLVWALPELLASFVAFAVAGLFEFGLHRRITFAAQATMMWPHRLGRLFVFLAIGVHSMFALQGWIALLDDNPPPLDSALGVIVAVAASTLGIVLTVVLSYVANCALTWPAGRAQTLPASVAPEQPGSQPRAVNTSSTSPEISVTARR